MERGAVYGRISVFCVLLPFLLKKNLPPWSFQRRNAYAAECGFVRELGAGKRHSSGNKWIKGMDVPYIFQAVVGWLASGVL